MHVKLSARKLYEADGHTVQELLKLLSLLYTNNGKESAQSSQQIEPERVVSDANLSHIVSKVSQNMCNQTDFSGLNFLIDNVHWSFT